jgi:hypothetical protein
LTALTKTYGKKAIDANHPFIKRHLLPANLQQKNKPQQMDG